MDRQAMQRPAVLDDLTTTQLTELLRQFDEGDRVSFDGHVASYGLDTATGDGLWDWFDGDGTAYLAEPVGPDDHVRGPEDAAATVVVYGDYECPDTREALGAIKALEQRIGDRFRMVYRHFPRRDRHPNAQAAAELAEAAAERGAFWEVHDHLIANQGALGPDRLNEYAAQFGITSEGGDGRVEAGHRYVDRVEDDLRGGLRSGVFDTPAIYVNGRRHAGGYDTNTLLAAIQLAR
jgi:protein-disulfide isomerase